MFNPATGEGAVAAVGGETIFWGTTPCDTPVLELEQGRASVSRTEVEDGSAIPYVGMVGTVEPVGSVEYKLLRVAGRVDDLTFWARPKNEWDICGGVAVLETVRKVYRRFVGRPNDFNQQSTHVPSGAVGADLVLAENFLGASIALRNHCV